MLKIYYLKVSEYAAFPEAYFLSYLGKNTCEVIHNYRNTAVRRRKLLGGMMIRRLLQTLLGWMPDTYSIRIGEHGKPYLEGGAFPFYYNLSHSGDYIICALSDGEVGVDMEQKGKVHIEVARRFFHPCEIEKLETLEGEELTELFFSYWSVKESYLKYTGSGLSVPLSSFEVCFETDGIRIRRNGLWEQVRIQACAIDKEYACFVCSSNGEDAEIQLFDRTML